MDRPASPPIPLGPRQRAAVAAALTILSVVVIVAAVLGLGWLLAQFVSRFSHVFLPLAVGWIGALVCRPYWSLLRERLRLPAALALAALFLSLLAPLAAFGWFFGALAVEQLSGLIERIPDWWTAVPPWLRAAPVTAILTAGFMLDSCGWLRPMVRTAVAAANRAALYTPCPAAQPVRDQAAGAARRVCLSRGGPVS